MSDALLQVIIDAEDRNTVVTTSGWSDVFSIRRSAQKAVLTDCWIDPIGNCLMLQPLQLLPDFRTSAGVDRLRLTAFNIITGNWEEVVDNDNLSSDYYLLSDGTANSEIESVTTWPEGRAFYLSTHVFCGNSDNFNFCQFTFGQYRLDLYSDGKTVLRKLSDLSNLVADGYVTPGPTDLSGKMLDLIIIPYKRRQILFWSPTTGKGWVYTDESLNWIKLTSRKYGITVPGKVKIKFPGGTGRVQFMPVSWKQDGTFISEPIQTVYPPRTGQEYTLSEEYDLPPSGAGGMVASVVNSNGVGAFVPDDITKTYCGHVALLGSVDYSPFFYYFSVDWPSITATTERDQLDITSDITKFQLHIAEDPRQSSAVFTVRNAGLTAYTHLRRKSGRHVVVKIGIDEIFWGILDPPQFTQDLSPETCEYQFTAQSIFRWFQQPTCPNSKSWDDLPHTDMMEWLCTRGVFAEEDLAWPETSGLALPGITEVGKDPIWQTKDGDTSDSWITKITDLTGWILHDVPSLGRIRLQYINREDLSTDSVAEFFLASADDPTNPADFKNWVRSLVESPEEPEATQVWVVGCRKDTEELMAAVYIDFKAEDGTLADIDRPDNWMGRAIPVKIEDPSLETMVALKKLAYSIGKEVTKTRIITEIEGEFRLGLWRYSPVTIQGEIFRILDMNIECELEVDGAVFRPTTYKLELIQ